MWFVLQIPKMTEDDMMSFSSPSSSDVQSLPESSDDDDDGNYSEYDDEECPDRAPLAK